MTPESPEALDAQRALADRLLAGGLLRPTDLLEEAPTRLGRYHVERLLGEGATGRVYAATDPDLRRTVAIKILDRGLTRNVSRFKQEMAVLAALSHPGIVTIYDTGTTPDGRPYYAMELAGEQTLDQAELPLRDAVRVMARVARACEAAHEKGIVHRDLKPGNILMGTRPMVADFGIAKVLDLDLTHTGQVLGTPHYMSPEQARGEAVDARTDVYALGVILYELATGRLPFMAGSLGELIDKIHHATPTAPRRLTPTLGRDLELVICTAMARSPAARYQTASALAADLEAWLEGRPIAVVPPGILARVATGLQGRLQLAALVTVSLVAFGLAAVVATREPPEGPAAPEPEPAGPPTPAVEPRSAPTAGALRLRSARQAIFDAALALQRWEQNLYRRTKRLSFTEPERVARTVAGVLEWSEMPGALRQQALHTLSRARQHLGLTGAAREALDAALAADGEGKLAGACHLERALLDWDAMVRAQLLGSREEALRVRDLIRDGLAAAVRSSGLDPWRVRLARALLGLVSDPEAAQATLTELAALRESPEQPIEEVAKLEADVRLLARDWAKAVEMYIWAIGKRHHYLQAYSGLAIARLLDGGGIASIEAAFKYALHTIDQNPRYEASYFLFTLLCEKVLAGSMKNLGKILMAIKPAFIDTTVDRLRDGSELLPDSPQLLQTYGTACVLQAFQKHYLKHDPMQSVAEAVRVLERAERLQPGAVDAPLGLGMVHLLVASRRKETGGARMARARACLRRALARGPRNPYVHRWLGYQCYLAEDWAGAVGAWETASELSESLKAELAGMLAETRRRAGR